MNWYTAQLYQRPYKMYLKNIWGQAQKPKETLTRPEAD